MTRGEKGDLERMRASEGRREKARLTLPGRGGAACSS